MDVGSSKIWVGRIVTAFLILWMFGFMAVQVILEQPTILRTRLGVRLHEQVLGIFMTESGRCR